RLGVPAAGSHVRYVKLFRMDKVVERYIPVRSLARGMSRIANLALNFQHARYFPPPDVQVTQHEGVFGEEFSDLDRNTRDLHTIRGLRTAEYLNWRYRQNPFNRYRVIVARRGAQLLGYAVLEMAERNWILTDLHA